MIFLFSSFLPLVPLYLFCFFFSLLPLVPALACVGGLCPQISVSRLPRDEASSRLGPGLRLGWVSGTSGCSRDSGERARDFQGFLPLLLSLPRRWRRSGQFSKGKAPRLRPEEHASFLFSTSFLLPGISLATIVVPVSNARGDGTSRRHRQDG